jgi:hypothetical protein
MCAVIVDRLTAGGNIIETGSDSYRLAHTKSETSRQRRTHPLMKIMGITRCQTVA